MEDRLVESFEKLSAAVLIIVTTAFRLHAFQFLQLMPPDLPCVRCGAVRCESGYTLPLNPGAPSFTVVSPVSSRSSEDDRMCAFLPLVRLSRKCAERPQYFRHVICRGAQQIETWPVWCERCLT